MSKSTVTESAGNVNFNCLKFWVMLISLAILKYKVKFLILPMVVEARNLYYLMHTKMFPVLA